MITIPIKALSVNKAWRGRRFKTNDYKNFETEMLYKLPEMKYDFDDEKLELLIRRWYKLIAERCRQFLKASN